MFNAWNQVSSCINSILNHTKSIEYEIIAIDDCSTKWFDFRREFPNIIYSRNPNNLGFGASCNIGLTMANGQFVVFMNSDVEILNDNWLTKFLEVSNTYDLVGVSSCRLMPDNNLKTFKHIGQSSLNIDYSYIEGHVLFGKKELFLELNGFDEIFFMYCEDVDLSWRVRSKGKRLGLIDDSSFRHLGGASTEGSKRQEWSKRSCKLLYDKWIK
jgi:hypothetical protein